MAKLEVTEERVVDVATKHPEARDVLAGLFPDVFANLEPFIVVGQRFKRKSFPNYDYAVVELDGYVKILNITRSEFWDESRAIRSCDCVMRKHVNVPRVITRGEFKRLAGCGLAHHASIDDFYTVPLCD